MVDGMRLALLQHGYTACGHKLELLVENDASYPATGVTMLRKLIEQDKVDVVSGFLMASVGYAVAPVADQYDTPLVMTSAAVIAIA